MQNLKNEFFELIQKDVSLFEQMQTQACDGFCYFDALQPTEKCWANPTFWKSLGYDISEILTISSNLFHVITANEKTTLLELFSQQFATKEPINKQDISFTTKAGSKMWFRVKIILSQVHENTYRFLCFFTDISKLKQKEIILEHCNREAKIGYWEIDLTTQTPIWSEVTKQIHEVPDDFVPDLNTAINFYKEGRSRNLISELVTESIETGKSYEVELEIVTAKGNIRWVKAIGMSEIVNGKCVKLYGLFQDIHDAKMRQEQIEAEKQKLNNVIDGTNVGTWEWNVKTGETVFNERWANIIGYTLEELSPINIETWLKFAHKDDLAISEKKLMECFDRKSEYYECECRMKHKNGEWVWVFDRGKVFSWTEDGKPLMMFGTHQDITQSKLEAERNKIFIQQAPNAIAMLDTNMVYIAASQQWVLDYNLTGKKVAGVSHYELFPEITNEWKTIHQECLNGAINKCDQALFVRMDGTEQWLKWDIRPWYTSANKIGGLVMCTENITQRVVVEQKLKISE
ncbi:MAG: PAS domain-containing protein, partial [Chitinophagaceae bacterium]